MIRLQNVLGVGEPCNPIKEAAVSVLFPSWTKFHKDRKDVYQQLLACSPGRCLRFLDFQQMFGRHDSVCISSSRNAVWSETTVILGPVMLRAHSFKIIGTRNRWVWSWVPHQYLLHFRLRWISQPLWASFSQCVIRQKKKITFILFKLAVRIKGDDIFAWCPGLVNAPWMVTTFINHYFC